MKQNQYVEELELMLESIFDDKNFRTLYVDKDGNHTYSAYINFKHFDDSAIAKVYRNYCLKFQDKKKEECLN